MTILVPLDFSENSNNSVEYAAELARIYNGELILLHVFESVETSDESIELAQEKMDVICTALKEEYLELKCVTQIIYGDLVDQILKTARINGVEMIVMGTQGATNFGKLFFGSNTAAVIERSECAVLSIPSSNQFSKPKKMLFATNFSREDIQYASHYVSLAKAFDATVIIAHVMTENERRDIEKSMIQIFLREIMLKTDYHKITYKLCSENTVSMGIDNLLHDTHADLIAFSTRKRGVFEKLYNPSLTQKFSQYANVPLLAYHTVKETV